MALGESTSPTSTFIDWSDSHWMYVKKRIVAINPNRQFGGIVEARAWPIQNAIPEAFYLLLGDLNPATRGANSWWAPLYAEQIRWAWLIIGNDVPNNSRMLNRGDKYVTFFTMQQELMQGMWPGFHEKLQYSLQEINGQPAMVGQSYNPKESLWYAKPRIANRYDQKSGILYGYALSAVAGFGPVVSG